MNIVRISFEMSVPHNVRLETLMEAADQSLVMMENLIEKESEPYGAPAGTGRVTVKFNNPKRRPK
jgi:hypothetical protein